MTAQAEPRPVLVPPLGLLPSSARHLHTYLAVTRGVLNVDIGERSATYAVLLRACAAAPV